MQNFCKTLEIVLRGREQTTRQKIEKVQQVLFDNVEGGSGGEDEFVVKEVHVVMRLSPKAFSITGAGIEETDDGDEQWAGICGMDYVFGQSWWKSRVSLQLK